MGRGRGFSLIVALALAGCFGSSSQGAGDAAADSSLPGEAGGGGLADATLEDALADGAHVDAGQDVGMEASSNAPIDAPADTATDSPPDSPADEASVVACDAGLASCGAVCVSLTTDTSCGACNRSCLGYGCNSDETCAVHSLLASPGLAWDWLYASGAVYLLQVDASPPSLYTLLRVPTDASPTVAMYSEPSGFAPGGLATDGTNVYWSVNASGVVTVWSLPLGAAAGATRTPVFQPATQPRWLRIRNGSFYWVSNTYTAGMGVYSRSLAGDAGDPGTEIVTDNTYSDFAVSDDALYWVSNQAGVAVLRTAAIAGGTPSTVSTLADSTTPMAVDGTYVYWTHNMNAPDAGVYRYTAGGSVQSVVTPGTYGTYGVLVSGNLAYFGVSGIVYSVAKSGGTATAIADTANSVSAFVGADAQLLYAVTFAGGPLIEIPR